MSTSVPRPPATPPDSIGRTEGSSNADIPQDLLLVVFIHGFKGTDSTFGAFPERLRHVLSETIPNVVVESIVFPSYETKGELNAAVVRFADWLTNLTVQREVANGVGGGAGKAKIILCGHSMGGLLAADALLEFIRTRPDPKAPLWPNIIACLTYDTPYFGVHPHVFKNTATQAAEYVRSAHNVWSNLKIGGGRAPVTPAPATAPAITSPPGSPSAGQSGWSKWAPAAWAIGGALVAGAAAGTAYYRRDDINTGYSWVTDHMKYVGSLWDENGLNARMENMVKVEQELGVMFRIFYTCLPPHPPQYANSRTFIVLPPSASPNGKFGTHFLQAPNGIATDEITAHTGMFDAKTNDGYYELGLLSAHMIRDVVVTLRTAAEPLKKTVALQDPAPKAEEPKTAATSKEKPLPNPEEAKAIAQPSHEEEDDDDEDDEEEEEEEDEEEEEGEDEDDEEDGEDDDDDDEEEDDEEEEEDDVVVVEDEKKKKLEKHT